MRYMLLIYGSEKAREALAANELQKGMDQAQAVMVEANRAGVFLAADPLQPTGTATTVRKQEDKVLITDGPFAETKEQLAGYVMLDCRDLDEAIEWASKFPRSCGGAGCIEVRPVREVPGFGRKQEMDAAAVHG